MSDPRTPERERELLKQARSIIRRFINEDVNGVICSVPSAERDFFDSPEQAAQNLGVDTPPHRTWCAKCQQLWRDAFAFDKAIESALSAAEQRGEARARSAQEPTQPASDEPGA